ncbi:flagellar basal-body MS-ring/collar protein FliF [Sphingomonas sp. BT-65]|uniref:flagellar basal-body MS-ring/collar protein FliF n=1 Tax=Sphingomonas sp. BT-65 TaxID=2989821 RepID=UPI0022369FF5|nr:flagellar basal-body MS-ring/collar protein FliF [Sphingomonas sp. BT-65]MCW4463794.1 flagellar basal-body MS-ring/collar protein FliF [Sphingomonas sp. BT-65]
MNDAMSDFASRRQYLVFGGVLAAIFAALALGYFLFLRADYAVLASGLRAEEASAIVAELDKRAVSYRIEDGGGTIRVPASEADATRVAIAGSDAAARGQIGFELFNKSDMGLTNFAQKINYQRALQGELVRTITAMEGVETARVHLGLPERSLFRGERTEPSAAVTVTMKQGRLLDPARVAGIQRLVAAAVPDLTEAKVVLLDGHGRVISAAVPSQITSDLDERGAIQAYYAARVRTAVEPILGPGKFSVRALVQTGAATGALPMAPGESDTRNFALRILLVTPAAIPGEDQAVVRDAVVRSIKADPGRGDSIELEIGPLAIASGPVAPPVAARAPQVADVPQQEAPGAPAVWPAPAMSIWPWILLAAVAAVLGVAVVARRRSRMTGDEHDAFAARLQRQLALTEEPGDAQHG